MSISRKPRSHYFITVITLAILCLGLGLRLGVLMQRAQANDVAFEPLDGSDELTYYKYARNLVAGDVPADAFYYHPGGYYALAAMIRVTGDDLFRARLGLILLDTLTIAAIMLTIYVATRRSTMATVAGGLLYALYPVALFYSTTFWDSTLSAALVAWIACLVVCQLRDWNIWRTLFLGLVCGWLVVTRQNLAPIVVLAASVLWWAAPRRHHRWHLAGLGIIILLVIAPFTIHNYQATGKFIPVATTGALELYMGNNRDSFGVHGRTVALDTLNIPPMDGLLRDLRLDSSHAMSLTLHKFLRFWSAGEFGNSYGYDQIRATTPLLQVIPVDHMWLCTLAMVGLIALVQISRKDALLLALMTAWLIVSFTITFSFSRIRFPVTPLLCILGGIGIGYMLEFIWYSLHGQRLRITRRAVAALTVGLLLAASPLMITPQMFTVERAYSALPADAIGIGAIFADTLELVGWRTFPQAWTAPINEWGLVGDAYAVELFWRLKQPTPKDYAFYIAYVENDERLLALDQQIGNISFPAHPTSGWDDQIYGEIVGFRLLTTEKLEKLVAGEIRVGVFSENADGSISPTLPTYPLDQTYIILQPFMLLEALPTPITNTLTPIEQVFASQANVLALTGLEVPAAAARRADIKVHMTWESRTEIDRDATVYLHLMHSDGRVAQTLDVLPDPDASTRTWYSGMRVTSTVTLTAPNEADIYDLFIGVRDSLSGERWQTNAQDNRPLLARIIVP